MSTWLVIAALGLAAVLVRPLANWRIRRAQEVCVIQIAEIYTQAAAEATDD